MTSKPSRSRLRADNFTRSYVSRTVISAVIWYHSSPGRRHAEVLVSFNATIVVRVVSDGWSHLQFHDLGTVSFMEPTGDEASKGGSPPNGSDQTLHCLFRQHTG